MLTQNPKPQAIFPDLPRNEPFLNPDGTVSYYWILWFQNMNMALQTNFSPEGFLLPSQSAANVNLLTKTQSKANVLYDSTNNVFEGNIFNTADGIPLASPTGAQHWIPFAMISTFAGNPNGNVAGYLTQLCLDTVGLKLYICTKAGQAVNIPTPALQAVWTLT